MKRYVQGLRKTLKNYCDITYTLATYYELKALNGILWDYRSIFPGYFIDIF